MKRIMVVLAALIQITAIAQQSPSPQQLYEEGYNYLTGIKKPYKPAKASGLFAQSASMGNAQAMNALGSMYARGAGVNANTDSALYWYKAAAAAGYANANYNLGRLYKNGTGVTQDFTKAAAYFEQGAALQDPGSKYMLAYMSYKGLGTNQSYTTAFTLFKQVAELGNASAMYFLGLCYRNGYGVAADPELSKQWLSKAALRQNAQASHELYDEPEPENISTVSLKLENELKQLKGSTEKYQASSDNNYEGVYTGFAIYYDWSGAHVIDIQPLRLNLQKKAGGYQGVWKEGEAEAAITLDVANNNFTFGAGSIYTRNNHYSDRKPEDWQFNRAQLQLGFIDDSTQLSGYVQFYSATRKEPGKPLQVILKKPITTSDAVLKNINLSLSPNPATSQAFVRFTLLQPARAGVVLVTQSGAVVYEDPGKLLPAGTYNYPISVANLAAGTYTIGIRVNGQLLTSKKLVKQ